MLCPRAWNSGFRQQAATECRRLWCFLWSRAPVAYMICQQIVNKGIKVDSLQDLTTLNIFSASTLSIFPSWRAFVMRVYVLCIYCYELAWWCPVCVGQVVVWVKVHDWIHVWTKRPYVGHVCEVTPLTVLTLVSYWPIADGFYQVSWNNISHTMSLILLSDNGGRNTVQCTEVLCCNYVNVSLFFIATLWIHSEGRRFSSQWCHWKFSVT
jgi:hypothetical protein